MQKSVAWDGAPDDACKPSIVVRLMGYAYVIGTGSISPMSLYRIPQPPTGCQRGKWMILQIVCRNVSYHTLCVIPHRRHHRSNDNTDPTQQHRHNVQHPRRRAGGIKKRRAQTTRTAALAATPTQHSDTDTTPTDRNAAPPRQRPAPAEQSSTPPPPARGYHARGSAVAGTGSGGRRGQRHGQGDRAPRARNDQHRHNSAAPPRTEPSTAAQGTDQTPARSNTLEGETMSEITFSSSQTRHRQTRQQPRQNPATGEAGALRAVRLLRRR